MPDLAGRRSPVDTTPSRRWSRLAVRVVGGVVAVVLILVIAVAIVPLGLFRDPVARAASAALGRPVTIGDIARLDYLSLTPLVRLSGVRIAQPAWVGPGDMATIADMRVRFAVLPLLHGAFVPIDVDVAGMKLALVRDANGRENWSSGPKRSQSAPRASAIPRLRHLRITGSSLHLADAKRQIDLAATVAADATGLTIAGHGTQRGRPLTLTIGGGRIDGIDPAAPYPFRLALASDLVAGRGEGTMAHVLDTGHFTAAVTVHGRDLAYLDDIIQAGVPATQDFDLTAQVRHDDPDWILTALKGRIGRSDLAGDLTVRRRDGRSLLDGHFAANAFDFDDLSSDAQKAHAAAETARIGKRIVPATAIHFEKLEHTDGTIHFTAHHLLSDNPSPFVGLDAVLKMDHRQLTVMPLTATLTHGTLGGRVFVDHRRGAPKLTVTLDLKGGRIEDLFAVDPKRADVPVDGRIRLHGSGDTVRAALGHGDGTITVFGQGGGMDYKVATLAAGDVVRGIGLALDGNHALAPIRCLEADFAARGGVLTADKLLLDTTVMRAEGSGQVRLPDERLALTLQGRSKHPDIVQSTVPIHIGGTLAKATFDVVPVDRSPPKKGLLGEIGTVLRSLKTRGDAGRAEVAPDAPCAAMAAAFARGR